MAAPNLGAVQAELIGGAVRSSLGAGSYLGFIPVQVGPATPYARNVRHWFHVILIIQAVVCFFRIVWLSDFLGGLWMILLCGLGWYARKEDMNITYICIWGLGCLVNGIFDTVGLVVPLIFNVLTLQVLEIFMRALVPASELLGAAFAWHLYLDYMGGGSNAKNKGSFASNLPDPMGKLVEEVDPEEYESLIGGAKQQGRAFRDQLNSDSFIQGVARGGEALQSGVGQLGQQVQQVQGQFGQLQPEPQQPPVGRVKKQAPCC